eukprot:Skav211217  [mRNA]  locus=scaffold934:142824:146645:- [translate_table: standard]
MDLDTAPLRIRCALVPGAAAEELERAANEPRSQREGRRSSSGSEAPLANRRRSCGWRVEGWWVVNLMGELPSLVAPRLRPPSASSASDVGETTSARRVREGTGTALTEDAAATKIQSRVGEGFSMEFDGVQDLMQEVDRRRQALGEARSETKTVDGPEQPATDDDYPADDGHASSNEREAGSPEKTRSSSERACVKHWMP